jgi:hypothetical protein
MAASSSILANLATVISNGPSTTTLASCMAAAGPIMDYKGNCAVALLTFKEITAQLGQIKTVTDSTDATNLGLINKLIAVMNGTQTPSTTYITDITSVITNGPNAATIAKAIAAAGPITDYVGMCYSVRTKLRQMNNLLTLMGTVTSASDDSTNKGLLADIVTGLA